MTVLLSLLAVAAISWLYRVSFTAILPPERLPSGLRTRMDAVAPAAFAALLAAHVAGAPTTELPSLVAAVVAAGVAAHLTASHVAAVLAAAAAWGLVSLL